MVSNQLNNFNKTQTGVFWPLKEAVTAKQQNYCKQLINSKVNENITKSVTIRCQNNTSFDYGYSLQHRIKIQTLNSFHACNINLTLNSAIALKNKQTNATTPSITPNKNIRHKTVLKRCNGSQPMRTREHDVKINIKQS